MSTQERYQRQMILPEIGEAGQAALASASVLVVGAGGLGCPVLQYLAAAGVGRIGIIDGDRVEASNLQRQILYTDADIGALKAEAAARRIQAMNADVIVDIYPQKLDAEQAEKLFPLYDVIVDGTDNFTAKFLINDAGVKFGKPVVYGAIYRFGGQVAVFDSAKAGPCYRCLFPEPPRGHIPNCAEAGIIGALAGMVGTTQALQVIAVIVGSPDFEPLCGKLWTIDGLSMKTRAMALARDPDCRACSDRGHDMKLEGPIEEIEADALADDVCRLVDVREDHEWQAGHIDGAVHVPLSGLLAGQDVDLPQDKPLVLYCHLGVRSQQAGEILRAKGYKNLHSLRGGIEAYWQCTKDGGSHARSGH